MKEDQFLHNKKIAISISESPDLTKNGFGLEHMRHFTVELAQQLLKAGAILVYGGDLRYNEQFNFVNVLKDLVRTYRPKHIEGHRVINYVCYPLHKVLNAELKADIGQFVELIQVDTEEDTSLDAGLLFKDKMLLSEEEKAFYDKEWAKGLEDMRTQMANETHARVIIGGKTEDYKGPYPGIREEAYYTDRKSVV